MVHPPRDSSKLPQAKSDGQMPMRGDIDTVVAEIRQRINAGNELWLTATGEPMPLEIEDIRAAAVRFGLSSDYALAGNFSLADVTDLMVGKRLAAIDMRLDAAEMVRDRVRLAASEETVQRSAGAVTPGTSPPGGTQAEAGVRRVKAVASRGSPKRLGDSETTLKMIAALTNHHRYSDESCLVDEPIANNELAKKAKVGKATASTFFKRKFKSYDNYKIICQDKKRLVASLKMLNGEFAPHVLLRPDPGVTNHDE